MKPVLKQAVLALLRETYISPSALYPIMFPNGRFNTERDLGSSKGGPSRMEYAVNNYLGRHAKGLVYRENLYDRGKAVGFGRYGLTDAGRELARAVNDTVMAEGAD